jgi:hypothetical protein
MLIQPQLGEDAVKTCGGSFGHSGIVKQIVGRYSATFAVRSERLVRIPR